MKHENDFGLIFWLHLAVILLIFASPLLVSWKVILSLIAVYYLQLLIFGGCILTKKQFKGADPDTTFYHYYLTKLGFNLGKRAVSNFVDYCLPWVVFSGALVWQIILSKLPLIF